jgi:hypothetical protein
LVLAVVAIAVATASIAGPPAAPIAVRRASESDELSTTSVTPAYLPPGTTAAPSVSEPGFRSVGENHYLLAGPANANTIPAGGVDDSNATTAHPATELVVTFVPNVGDLPALPVDPEYFTISHVTVAGLPAVQSTPKDGFGVHRIDWVDAAGYHVVLCERFRTPEGTSGLPVDELVHIASSLYE